MCQFQLDREEFQKRFHICFDEYFRAEQSHLEDCLDNGLITMAGERIKVTELGKIFIRNVCMGFDSYLEEKTAFRQFSQTI